MVPWPFDYIRFELRPYSRVRLDALTWPSISLKLYSVVNVGKISGDISVKKIILVLGFVAMFTGSKAMALPGQCWCDVAYNGASASGLVGNYIGMYNTASDCSNTCASKPVSALSCGQRADRYYKFRIGGSWTNTGNSVVAAACQYHWCKLVYSPGGTSVFTPSSQSACANSPVNPGCGVTATIYYALSTANNASNVNNWVQVNSVSGSCPVGDAAQDAQMEQCSFPIAPAGGVVEKIMESKAGPAMTSAGYGPDSTHCNAGPVPPPIINCYQLVKLANNASINGAKDQCFYRGGTGFDSNGFRAVIPGTSYASYSGPKSNVTCSPKLHRVLPSGGNISTEDVCYTNIIHVDNTVKAAALPAINLVKTPRSAGGIGVDVIDGKDKTGADTKMIRKMDDPNNIAAPAVEQQKAHKTLFK